MPEHDPEKWKPVFQKDHAQTKSQRMIRKVETGFPKDHAQTKSQRMIRKSGNQFSEKIMRKQKIGAGCRSNKTHPSLPRPCVAAPSVLLK
jgi:hypothetical protein